MEFSQFYDDKGGVALTDGCTLVAILEDSVSQAATDPANDSLAYRFVDYSVSRDGTVHDISWAQFGSRLHAVAARLQQVTSPGDRVAILAPQGLDYIVSFYAAMHAGTIAVPLFDPREPGHHDRLEAVLGNCTPSAILTSTDAAVAVRQFFRHLPAAQRPRIIAVDGVPDSVGEKWTAPEVTLDDVAYLQYTSGSTRVPAGVEITHRSVVTNALQMISSLGMDAESRGVTWLPLFHDMGLLNVILPVLLRSYVTVMTPQSFVQRPVRWIRHLAETNDGSGTFAAAPNFAFELAARRGRPTGEDSLDLSHVVSLINGSEPVTPKALRAFTEAFAPYGLRESAVKPSYGMAEATLFVSTPRQDDTPLILWVHRDELAAGRLIEVSEEELAAALGEDGQPAPDSGIVAAIGCGYMAPSQWAVIVEPEKDGEEYTGRGRELEDGHVGEIWLHGENLGRAYWDNDETTTATFRNRLVERRAENSRTTTSYGTVPEDAAWLRTGDYGVMYRDQLFITGRVKDLVIIDGRNHYPQDLEHTAQTGSPTLRPGFIAAFSVPRNELPREVVERLGGVDAGDSSEKLVIVAERAPGSGKAEAGPVAEEVRAAIGAAHAVKAVDVLLVPAGSVPRTSSGKIARSACRAAYLDGSLRGGYQQDAFPDLPDA